MVSFQCRRSLCHLHQRVDSLLHSGTSGTGKYDNRKSLTGCLFYCTGNFFANHLSHARHHKPPVTDCKNYFISRDPRFSGYNRLIKPGLFLQCFYLFFIAFIMQRISRSKSLVPLFKGIRICYHFNPAHRMHTEIILTFWTDIIPLLHILCQNGRFANVTFFQKSLRNLRCHMGRLSFAKRYVPSSACFLEHI